MSLVLEPTTAILLVADNFSKMARIMKADQDQIFVEINQRETKTESTD